MTRERYAQLVRDDTASLTTEEVDAGWHFCPDWDFMLIHASDPEIEGCTCG